MILVRSFSAREKCNVFSNSDHKTLAWKSDFQNVIKNKANKPTKGYTFPSAVLIFCLFITEEAGSQGAGLWEARASSDCVGRGHLSGSVQRGDPRRYVCEQTQLQMSPKCLQIHKGMT